MEFIAHTMKTQNLKTLLLWSVIALAGCSQKTQTDKSAESGGLKPESAHSAGMTAAPTATGGLKLAPATGWIVETPSSSSRKAQYKLPRAEGDSEDAGLVVYYFNGGGGTPQANADRWIAEFAGPDGKPATNAAKIARKTVNNIPLTLVDVSGTYASSMGMTQQGGKPKSGVRLLGAIAETGNGPWFIKLTGPERTVAKWKPSFDSFLDSLKPGE
jgi:hypothetical protein